MLKKFLSAVLALYSAAVFAAPLLYNVSMHPEGAIHPVGTTAKFTGTIINGDYIPDNAKVFYEEFVDGICQRSGYLKVGEKLTLERKLDRPCWYNVRLRIVDAKNRNISTPGIRSIGRGIVIAPEKIARGGERPADFDKFWESRRAMLDKVPVKELYRKKVDYKGHGADKVDVFDIKVACAGNGPMTGILTMPKNAAPKSLPAIVLYMGAGVRTSSAHAGYGVHALTFYMNAHSIDNMQSKEYYRDLNRGKLKNYRLSQKNDREKIYFHDMFLRVMRSLDYVKSLPEWNGKVLIVSGGSQGGAQAIVAAAMDPQVNLMFAEVPAMCDHQGSLLKNPRRRGWPGFCDDDKSPEVIAATAYYDMVNFAGRIKCESFVTAGALDHVCPPNGAAAAFNAIPAKKKVLLIHPSGEHILPQLDREFRAPVIQRIMELFQKNR